MNINITITLIVLSIFVILFAYSAFIISSNSQTPEEKKYEDDMQIKWLKENIKK
jgi:hypothetical protein